MAQNITSRFKSLPQLALDTVLAFALAGIGCVLLALRPALEPHFRDGKPPKIPAAGTGLRTIEAGPFGPSGSPSPWAYVVTGAALLPLALRNRFPLSVLAATSVAAAVYEVGHFPPSIAFVAPLVALYTVATMRDRRTVIVAGLLSAAVQLTAAYFTVGTAGFWTEFIRVVALLGVAGALGDATRNRHAYVAEVEQRAADAERTHEEEASRRVDEERLRIARELHDITAHSLSIIAVQSGAAAHVIDTNPAEAAKALEAIRRTSRDALDELRAMLGVLRAGEDSDAPLAPAPGLARVGDLVAPLIDAGFSVTVDVAPDLGEIPAVVEGSAYRILQEALTNVVRHAGVCRVSLRVRREADQLVISVDDDGAGPATPVPPGGHGLAGMRERVTALGGTFEAAPLLGGGFHVGARLPLARSAS